MTQEQARPLPPCQCKHVYERHGNPTFPDNPIKACWEFYCGCDDYSPAPLVRGPGASEGEPKECPICETPLCSHASVLIQSERHPNRSWHEAGKRMRAERKAAGLTMGDVARQRGISVSDVSAMEMGRVEPKPACLRPDCEAHGEPSPHGDYVPAPVGEPAAAALRPDIVGCERPWPHLHSPAATCDAVALPLIRDHVPPEPADGRERCHFCCGCIASMCLHSRKACPFCSWCDDPCPHEEGPDSHQDCRQCLRDLIEKVKAEERYREEASR